MKLNVVSTILLLTISYQLCKGSPLVITPKQFRFEFEQKIVIISRNNELIHITLKEVSITTNLLYNNSFNVTKDKPLQIPITISSISSSTVDKVILTVITESGEKSESYISLLLKSGYGFIQTDKPIYTPKENVQIRMIRLDQQLKPFKEKFKLRIKNSQRIIVEEATLMAEEPNYFVDYKFILPPAPKLGIWVAEMLYGRNYTSNYTVTFELREYILPTFSIKLKSPQFILPSHENVTGSVQVDYVYGKPVNGSVIFKFGVKEKNGRINFIGSTNLKPLVNGSAYYLFLTNNFRQFSWFPELNGNRFVVEVTVHERVTGNKDKAVDDHGLFVNSPYVISFKNSFLDFKPDIEAFITGEVYNMVGKPVPDLPVSLHLMDERGRPLLQNSSHLKSDHLGRVSLPITLKKGMEQLHVTIRTEDPNCRREEQAEGAHVLNAYESENDFISIANKAKYSTTLIVGDTYQSALVIRGAIFLDHIYLVVVSRGTIIDAQNIQNEREIKINITREMIPNIRIFVVAFTRNDELVADSVRINIYENNCGFNLNVENNMDDIKPGSLIKIIINGSEGDSVALLGVDEAVYVLRDEDRLTKTKVSKEILKLDNGCGPGGGKNVIDVANNVGIKLTSSKLKYSSSDISDGFCHKTIRVKRQALNIIDQYRGKTRKCCILGMMPSNRLRSCNHKLTILKSHLPEEQACHDAFMNCCLTNSGPKVSYSVASTVTYSGAKPTDTRTRIGSGTEEFVHIAYEEELEKMALIRSDFSETWLFDIVLLNKSTTKHEVALPHSITTWSLIGMSLSPKNGLCLMSSPFRIRSFQDVFIQLSLPYSVVQNEQMEMIVTIFNYRDKRLHILINFYGVENLCSEAVEPGSKAKKNLAVDANSFGTVAFPMVPLQVGDYQLKVAALWPTGSDVVIKTLHVLPPGIPVEDEVTFQLDPLNRQKRNKRSIVTSRLSDEIIAEQGLQNTEVKIVYPYEREKIVPNTKACIISGIADQFGSSAQTTLEDIDDLIRQPKGCGEQTMLYMAPTLFTLKYLDSIDRLSGDTKHRALKYLRDGYKRELSFRKDDGSFSAFPIRPSSIWLTAFVMKVFCQSSSFLPEDKFDNKVISSGIEWLFSKQQPDGSWIELNTRSVIHEESLGGIKGAIPMTAYIVIALHECRGIVSFDSFNKRLNSSEEFLKKNQQEIINRRDTYVMALVAYSLTFTDNRNSFKLMDALNNYSNTDNNKNYKFWRNTYEIEATSYALLAFLNSGFRNSIDALSIANWLNSRRSYSGSFESTQDTIVALEALSKFATTQSSFGSNLNMVCNVTYGNNQRKVRSISFNKENALILQKFEVESESDILRFTTTGNGMGQMLIKLKFNVLEPPEVLCKFDIDIKVNEWRESAVREDPDFDNDVGEDFFSDFPVELINTLDIKTRKKRSFFWNRRNSAKKPITSTESSLPILPIRITNEKNLHENDLNVNINFDNNEQFIKNNLSVNKIDNKGSSKLVLLLDICVRHIPRYNSEMSIIDVGLISGYKPNIDDLNEIVNTIDSLVSKFEISERNIVFYLDKVPSGRPYCIQFRLIQQHSVSNSQAAIIKVYDYYKMDHSCSQLYTPTRISEYIETKCNSEVCICAKRENCPSSKSLIEIGTIYEKRIIRARELFQELVCNAKYHYVYAGNFIQQNDTKHGYKLFRFLIKSVFKGNYLKEQSFWLTMNRECDDPTSEIGREAIVFGQLYDNTHHLNGSSILYDITKDFKSDTTRTNVLSLISWMENTIRRNNWRCAQ